jgi:hypothetical protein
MSKSSVRSQVVLGQRPLNHRVNLGTEGDTPRKEFSFDREAPPTSIETATPQRSSNSNNNVLKSGLKKFSKYETINENSEFSSPPSSNSNPYSRPKTSRGKAQPSPDEFANYIIQSPQHTNVDSEKVMFFHSNEDVNESTNDASLPHDDEQDPDDFHINYMDYLRSSDDDSSDEEEVDPPHYKMDKHIYFDNNQQQEYESEDETEESSGKASEEYQYNGHDDDDDYEDDDEQTETSGSVDYPEYNYTSGDSSDMDSGADLDQSKTIVLNSNNSDVASVDVSDRYISIGNCYIYIYIYIYLFNYLYIYLYIYLFIYSNFKLNAIYS